MNIYRLSEYFNHNFLTHITLKSFFPYLLAMPLHELGHILVGGLAYPYMVYGGNDYDPLTFVLKVSDFDIYTASAGFVITLPLLLKYRSPYLLVWFLIQSRWDFVYVISQIV